MSGKKRVLLLVAIMAVACMVSTITTIVVLYRTALEEQRDVLISIAKEHVRLIEELAGTNTDQNMKVGGGEAESALLKKIASAHSHFDGIGHTGEFKLAKRVGNNIVFLLDHRYKEVELVPIPMNSNRAEPMRLALSGYTGSIVGSDYRGVKVLAAYEPVPGLHWGVVAKVDLAELRVPFARAGLLAMAIASILVLLGSLIFIRITNPIIARLQENSQHLMKLVASLQQSEESLLKAHNELETRVEERTANLAKVNEQLGIEVNVRTRAEERLQTLWTIAKKVNAEVEELCDHVLQGTIQMTRSNYAFYGFLNADESLITMYSWSKEALENCRMITKPIEHSVERAGIWAEAIRQRRVIVVNDYQADSPGKKGVPEGHVQIARILAVPVFSHDRIVAVVVAANKDSDYTKEDESQIESFASGVQLIIDKRKIEGALRSSEMECRLLSRQVIDAQEKERKRLASEFHDGIGQSLAAIKYRAEGYMRRAGDITPEGAQELKDLVQMIRDAMDEVRKIQNDLHPAYLDMMGLTETISDFCEKFQATYTNIQSTLQIDISEQDLPNYLRVPIFRIFQEAMNNAAKHSHADRILVSIRREADTIELAIKDNGAGFILEDGLPTNGQGKGLGLFSMRERAGLSGGSFEFKTAPGKGTSVVSSWPLVTIPSA
jgi:signal transduction histidine kinase